MGFHGFSFGSLILILIIAILLFGTKRIRNIGEDIGAAIKSFRKGLQGDEQQSETIPIKKPTEMEESTLIKKDPSMNKQDHV